MTFKFLKQLPNDFSGKPFLISGQESVNFTGQEFLTVEDHGVVNYFEIRYRSHGGAFKEVCLLDKILGVGHEEHFYLFDLETKTSVAVIQIDWYFDHLYLNDRLFYIAGANRLYCVDRTGKLIWKSAHLGIDGVIVEAFDDDVILGAGEWDPPGGWRKFKLHKVTGELIE